MNDALNLKMQRSRVTIRSQPPKIGVWSG